MYMYGHPAKFDCCNEPNHQNLIPLVRGYGQLPNVLTLSKGQLTVKDTLFGPSDVLTVKDTLFGPSDVCFKGIPRSVGKTLHYYQN